MRQLVLVTSEIVPPFEKGGLGGILLPEHRRIPFSNSKTLLGQEFPYAIYDMRAEGGVCLHLEALAIVAGTIQAGGTLYLLCPAWDDLEHQLDFDALRWNANQAVPCPNFYAYFKQLVKAFGFKKSPPAPLFQRGGLDIVSSQKNLSLTAEQQNILQNLPLAAADIHLITAPRGRGKSTISGKLAEKMAQTHSVIITARSHAALPNFWKGISSETVQFFAPDQLLQAVENQQLSANQWLFIDEAASLPLPMLQRFCDYFAKVVLTTTTQNYEGTGRGFSLKLLAQVKRPAQQWALTKPLRWGENDPLEAFINALLLLDEPIHPRPLAGEGQLGTSSRSGKQGEGFYREATTNLAKITACCPLSDFRKNVVLLKSVSIPQAGESKKMALSQKIAYYHLLAAAHYKTTPTDLRRLFDAPDQRFYSIEQNQQLLAVCWAMDEGGLDEDLTQAIWRGERRPQGNLVAQYLCFQGNLPDACRLRSVRLSRIAVQPEFQRQGIGKRLISKTISQLEASLDFVSVSFGMSEELLKFWTECGFELVQITPLKEASSGYRSAMMIYPLSEAGKAFVAQAKAQFWRDLPLQPFFADLPPSLQDLSPNSPLVTAFLAEDRQNLAGFIHAQRSFSACFVSLKRLYLQNVERFPQLQQLFERLNGELPIHKKAWLEKLRHELSILQDL